MDKCLICGSYLPVRFDFSWLLSWQKIKHTYVCQTCLDNFVPIDKTKACSGCGRLQVDQSLCADCQRWQKMGAKLLHNRALYVYDEPMMKDYIEHYKFMGDYQWRLVFQTQFREFILQNYPKDYLYCPIPVDQSTLQTRGFNQVKGLCEPLNLQELLAFKDQVRQKQSHKTRKQRMETKQPFVYLGPPDLQQQKIVLIDDIYTTGRTLYHAAKLLDLHQAGEIVACTLAR